MKIAPPDVARLPLPDTGYIAYRRSAGRGPGVLFLGGFMSDMTGTKATFLERWCRRRKRAFVRFDYRGHGASSGRFEEGTIGLWRADAIAVLDQLTSGPQILVGSSMGGWIMLLVARARPERVAGLVGIASAADLTENMIWARLDPDERQTLASSGAIEKPSNYGDTPYVITRQLIEEGRRHLLLASTIPLQCPVRLLHGMGDTEVPWRTSLRIAEQLATPDARVVLIKDGDHRLSRPQDLSLLSDTLEALLATLHPLER